MQLPYRVAKPSQLDNTDLFGCPIRWKILDPIIQFFKLNMASSSVDLKLRKSFNLTSFIVWETLEFPTTEKPNFSFLHSFAVCTKAPRPDESRKSTLLKSMTNGSCSFLRKLLTKFLNCFSENASSWPLKVKTIIFAFTSVVALNETVSFWKSSMIKILQK